jgi:hypothetical protein
VGHTTLAAHYIPEEIEMKRERENLTSVDGSAVLQRRKWRERRQENVMHPTERAGWMVRTRVP